MTLEPTTGINILFKILAGLETKLKQDALKEDLAIALKTPLKNMKKATNEFIYAFYLMSGANMAGFFIEPLDPEKSAAEIVIQFFKSYEKFVNSCKNLAKYLSTHKDEFKDLLSPHDIIALELFIESFKNDKFDIKFLYEHGIFKEMVVDEYEREKKFPFFLSSKFNEEFAKSTSLSNLSEILKVTNNDITNLATQIFSELALEKIVDNNEDEE
ncbi:MAG: hypothetical protein ABSB80_12130 [Methanoregula sp.]|jgi:hypothetical protein|uniref:hypothetical protein n=1 Tax=Methanoregula sp. TaxID=2052170 RepID=UPI003D0971CD